MAACKEAGASRSDVTSSEDDDVLVEGVMSRPQCPGLLWFGLLRAKG